MLSWQTVNVDGKRNSNSKLTDKVGYLVKEMKKFLLERWRKWQKKTMN